MLEDIRHKTGDIGHKEINNMSIKLKVKQDLMGGYWEVIDGNGDNIGRLSFCTKEEAKAHMAHVKEHVTLYKLMILE